jgi:hypothetical protein
MLCSSIVHAPSIILSRRDYQKYCVGSSSIAKQARWYLHSTQYEDLYLHVQWVDHDTSNSPSLDDGHLH